MAEALAVARGWAGKVGQEALELSSALRSELERKEVRICDLAATLREAMAADMGEQDAKIVLLERALCEARDSNEQLERRWLGML